MNVKIEPHESGLHDISMVKTSQILTVSNEDVEIYNTAEELFKKLGI